MLSSAREEQDRHRPRSRAPRRGPRLLPARPRGRLHLERRHLRHPRTRLSTVSPGWLRIWTDTGANEQYYPLVFTTYWIEKRLWGLHPFGFHLVNVLVHAGAALLLWRFLRRLGLPGAWFAAATFALHPLCVESVAWITELKNTLSLVLVLACRAHLALVARGRGFAGRAPAVEEEAEARHRASRPAPARTALGRGPRPLHVRPPGEDDGERSPRCLPRHRVVAEGQAPLAGRPADASLLRDRCRSRPPHRLAGANDGPGDREPSGLSASPTASSSPGR